MSIHLCLSDDLAKHVTLHISKTDSRHDTTGSDTMKSYCTDLSHQSF